MFLHNLRLDAAFLSMIIPSTKHCIRCALILTWSYLNKHGSLPRHNVAAHPSENNPQSLDPCCLWIWGQCTDIVILLVDTNEAIWASRTEFILGDSESYTLMFRGPVKMLIKIYFIVENDTFEARVSPKTSISPPESVHIIHPGYYPSTVHSMIARCCMTCQHNQPINYTFL